MYDNGLEQVSDQLSWDGNSFQYICSLISQPQNIAFFCNNLSSGSPAITRFYNGYRTPAFEERNCVTAIFRIGSRTKGSQGGSRKLPRTNTWNKMV